MKALPRSLILRLVFVVVAAGSAYLLGYRHADTQPPAVVTTTKHAQSAPAPAVAAASFPAPISPARQQEWEQFKALLENPDHSGMLQALLKLQNQLAQTDREAIPFILEQIAGLPPGYGRDLGLEHLFIQLISSDPSKALTMVDLISDPKERNDMINRSLAGIAKHDPSQAVAALANLPDGPQAQGDYHSVFSAWAGANSTTGAAAGAAALELPPGAERTQALAGVAVGWVGNRGNPDLNVTQAALDWASSLPPADSTAVLNDALTAATKQDPALAAQYVGKLTDASVRNKAIQSLARIWAVPVSPGPERDHQDPSAALTWLDQVATGDTYDTNVEYIFSKLNPATAATLIDQVTDPAVRETVIATVATAWERQDPQATLAWLQTLPAADAATRDPLVQKLGQSAGGNARP